jgi:hypothetical protein
MMMLCYAAYASHLLIDHVLLEVAAKHSFLTLFLFRAETGGQ